MLRSLDGKLALISYMFVSGRKPALTNPFSYLSTLMAPRRLSHIIESSPETLLIDAIYIIALPTKSILTD
jgi:hypothetical protein